MNYLASGESLIVYPDVNYTFDADQSSEIYSGFLFLAKLYKQRMNKDLRFIPICDVGIDPFLHFIIPQLIGLQPCDLRVLGCFFPHVLYYGKKKMNKPFRILPFLTINRSKGFWLPVRVGEPDGRCFPGLSFMKKQRR